MDFDPEEVEEIVEELRAAAEAAKLLVEAKPRGGKRR